MQRGSDQRNSSSHSSTQPAPPAAAMSFPHSAPAITAAALAAAHASAAPLAGPLNPATWSLDRGLYGGAIAAAIPKRFTDCSSVEHKHWTKQAAAALLARLLTRSSASVVCVASFSDFRQIPDHQEVWADADTDQSIIIELNSLDESVPDELAATSVELSAGRRGCDSSASVRLSLTLLSLSSVPTRVCSHYMQELSVANDALSSELISSGPILPAAMPGFESATTPRMPQLSW